MQLIFPGQVKRWASFYQQMHQLVKAGFLLPQALEKLLISQTDSEIRSGLQILSRALKSGRSFPQSIQMVSNVFPSMDRALLIAGEESGRLEHCLMILSQFYQKNARARSELFSKLAYPFFLVLLMILMYPTSDLGLLAQGGFGTFLGKKIVPMGIYLGLIYGFLLLTQNKENSQSANSSLGAGLMQILKATPVAGAYLKNSALSRFCLALEGLTSAGITPEKSWDLAAKSSGSSDLQSAVIRVLPELKKGRSPSELLANMPEFPSEFTGPYSTAEISGSIEESLKNLASHFSESAEEKMQIIVTWLPKVIFILIAIALAYQMVQNLNQSFKELDKI